MNKERFEIELNQEDVQNIINCYEKDIKLIEQLQQQNKELKEKFLKQTTETYLRQTRIDKAIEYINNNGEKQYNSHDNYRGKWYSPDELDTILEILKDSDVDE